MSQKYFNKVSIPLFESYCKKQQVDGVEIEARVANVPLRLKVASTPESQAQGYMNSQSEPNDGDLTQVVIARDRLVWSPLAH